MLGEHGDSQSPYLSGATVAGTPLADFPGYSRAMVDEVVNATRFGGAEVIKRKGGTFYAVAPMISELIKAIKDDTHQVLPVSTRLNGEFLGMKNVALSLPCVIGKQGRTAKSIRTILNAVASRTNRKGVLEIVEEK